MKLSLFVVWKHCNTTMRYEFTKEYVDSLTDNPDSVKEINPKDCSAKEFKEIMCYLAVQAAMEIKTLKNDVVALQVQNDELKTSVENVKRENIDLQRAMDEVVEVNLNLRRDLDQLLEKNAASERTVMEQADRIKAVEQFKVSHNKAYTDDRERILKLERHSRGRNLRFCLETPETDKEDTTMLLQTELMKVNLDVHVEHSQKFKLNHGWQ